MDLHITFRGLDTSPAAEERIRAHARELEQFSDRVTSCRVVVERVSNRHRQGDVYDVRVDLSVAGGKVVVNREPGTDHAHADLAVAIRDAFDAVRRRLQDHMRVMEGETKRHEGPAIGTVVRLFPDRDYGFLDAGAEGEVYFHRNAVKGRGFAQLQVGDRVRFVLDPEPAEKGAHASAVFPH